MPASLYRQLTLGRGRKAVVIALGLVCGTILALAIGHPSFGPRLSTATPEQAAKSGALLFNPLPWDFPNITKAQAEAVAVSQEAPGTPAISAVLAEVIKTNPNAELPRLCWVVELPAAAAQSNGPRGSAPIKADYYLSFIDAHSGVFLWGVAGK